MGSQAFQTIGVELDDFVATVEIQRPPNNFFTIQMIGEIASALESLDEQLACRAIVLCAQGKHFCAGNDFSESKTDQTERGGGVHPLYEQAIRLFKTRKPIVAAVQGAAVGGGLGLAMAADFRVAAPEARFSANFTLLGYHHGFGLTVTLPRVIGAQQANLLLYTGRRLKGEEARAIGLCEYLVPLDEVRNRAHQLAREIATAAPMSIEATRATMRAGLADAFEKATGHEATVQAKLHKTQDFLEGVDATKHRRPPNFVGS